LPDGAQEALDAFVAAKELRAYAEGQKDVYEQIIREMLDGADIGTLKGKEVVRLNKSHNSHFDAAILRDGFPEAYEAAKKRTDYDYLSVR
jgi:predicted aspartyl protease